MKYTLLFSPSEGVRYADRQRLHTKNRAKVRKKNGMCKFFEWKMKKTPEIPEKPAIPERTKNRGGPHTMWEKKHNTSANHISKSGDEKRSERGAFFVGSMSEWSISHGHRLGRTSSHHG